MTNNTEEKQETNIIFYINAALQLGAIFIFQNMGIVWPLYITMAMLSILIFLQTIAAGFIFSKNGISIESSNKSGNNGIGILISMIYMVSCYHIYLIGFVGFAWFAFAHVIIQFFGNLFGVMKK